MNIILDGLIATSLLAGPVGYLLSRRIHKIVYKKHDNLEPHLRFGFTLDGILTDEEVPIGVHPVEAAKLRSDKEKRNYSARRI